MDKGPGKTLPVIDARAQAQIVRLNIGGTKYLTSMATLSARGSNFFVALVENDKSGRCAWHLCAFSRATRIVSPKDEKGFYFVDRNGRIFELILDYLRNGKLVVPPSTPLASVLLEMDYYGISHDDCVQFVDELRQRTSVGPIALSPTEQSAYDKCWPLIRSTLLAAADLGRSHGSGFVQAQSGQYYFWMHSLPGIPSASVAIAREEHIAWCSGTENRLWLYIQHRHGISISWNQSSEINFSW